jgi:hypothetical protein
MAKKPEEKPKVKPKVTENLLPQSKPELVTKLQRVCGDLARKIIEAERQYKNTGQPAQSARLEALKEALEMFVPLAN